MSEVKNYMIAQERHIQEQIDDLNEEIAHNESKIAELESVPRSEKLVEM